MGIPLALLIALSASGGERLAVLELKPLGASADLAHTLTNAIAEQAGKIPGITAMSQSEIAAMIGLEKQKQLLGCGDESCLAEIGGALGAKQVISGSLGMVGPSFVIQLELVDTAHAKVLGRESRTVDSPAELVMAARDLAHRLLTGKPLDLTGRLKLVVTPDGAKVIVDGKLMGKSPLAQPLTLDEGTHKLHVEADGYISTESTVEAVPGQTIFNEVELVSIAPIAEGSRHQTQRTISYIAFGATAAALAVATYFGLTANYYYGHYQADIYNYGDPSVGLTGATGDENSTKQYATPANYSFAAAGVLGAVGVGMLIWGLTK